MPVRGTSKKTFKKFLDKIAEIIQTYKSSHVVFVVGGMNSSMIDRRGNERDKLLEHFISENNLLHAHSGAIKYIHSDTPCSSAIDFIFYSKKWIKITSWC